MNVILRTIFGAEGAELEELRKIVPRYAKFGSAMVKFMPVPKLRTQRYSPWSRMDEVRSAFDQVIFTLIERAEAVSGTGVRTDVLALPRAQRACSTKTGHRPARYLRRTGDPSSVPVMRPQQRP